MPNEDGDWKPMHMPTLQIARFALAQWFPPLSPALPAAIPAAAAFPSQLRRRCRGPLEPVEPPCYLNPDRPFDSGEIESRHDMGSVVAHIVQSMPLPPETAVAALAQLHAMQPLREYTRRSFERCFIASFRIADKMVNDYETSARRWSSVSRLSRVLLKDIELLLFKHMNYRGIEWETYLSFLNALSVEVIKMGIPPALEMAFHAHQAYLHTLQATAAITVQGGYDVEPWTFRPKLQLLSCNPKQQPLLSLSLADVKTVAPPLPLLSGIKPPSTLSHPIVFRRHDEPKTVDSIVIDIVMGPMTSIQPHI